MKHSWSKLRKMLEQEYLCEALRGHVQYFFTIYHNGHDAPGRFAVLVDGKEVWRAHAFNEGAYDEIAVDLKNAQQIPKREWNGEQILNDEENRAVEEQAVNMANEIGIASTWDVIAAIEEYLNLNIAEALQSPNAIIRMLAVMDRRVGKRRIEKMWNMREAEPVWIRKFLELRMSAEKLTNNYWV